MPIIYSPSRMAWEKENAMLYIENWRMLLRKRRMPIIYSPSWMTWGKGERLFYITNYSLSGG